MTRHSFITAWIHHGRRFLDDSAMLLAVHIVASWFDGEENGETDIVGITSQHEARYPLIESHCLNTLRFNLSVTILRNDTAYFYCPVSYFKCFPLCEMLFLCMYFNGRGTKQMSSDSSSDHYIHVYNDEFKSDDEDESSFSEQSKRMNEIQSHFSRTIVIILNFVFAVKQGYSIT